MPFNQPQLQLLILILKAILFHSGLCRPGKSRSTGNQMALVKDRGHPSGLPEKGDPFRRIYWRPADSVSWHRPSVTTPVLVLVVGWCHVGCCRLSPFCVHLRELYSPCTQDRQLNQGLLATWVSPFLSSSLFQKDLHCNGISLAPPLKGQWLFVRDLPVHL